MRRLIRRIARTSPAEIRFRSVELAHTARERLNFAAGRERWDRSRLLSRLHGGSAALRRAARGLETGDWLLADAAIREHFVARPCRFVLAPDDRSGVPRAIGDRFPDAHRAAAARAEDLLRGRYDLLGYRGLSFETSAGEVDWHLDPVHQRRAPRGFWSRVPYLDPAVGDHKIIWELNRHQHWLTLGRAAWLTGDDRYARRFTRELGSWLRANPPLAGINWSSMLELAFRSISWIWALHLFASFPDDSGEPAFVDLLLGLDRQLEHVAHHLSTYFSPNTHLLGEGLALYVAGRSLPELKAAARWDAVGRAILLREASAQVHPDGGHAELSTHYHRYALDFYLLALVLARRTSDPAADAFADAALRLATFCRRVADDRGRLPTIGDDDGGLLFPMCGRAPWDAADSLGVAAALLERSDLTVGEPTEEAIWMLGAQAVSRPGAPRAGQPPSHLFPDTGYAVLRSSDAQAIVDVGRHGFMNGGHAHSDALALLLSVNGRPLLIDPGTSTYTMDAERRDRFRSTAMHNTAAIDGRAQSLPDGPFHWRTQACARVDFWRGGDAFDYIEASHDGYLPVVHRRAVLRAANGLWLVADHVLGQGRHRVDVHWHFSPDWRLSPAENAVVHADGTAAALASTASESRDYCGDPDGLGWCAPVYGQLQPAPTRRCSSTAHAPFSVVTAIATGASSKNLTLDHAAVTSETTDGWHTTAALVRWSGGTALVFFATPLQGNAARAMHSVATPSGEFRTDARAALLQVSADGRADSLLAIDCTLAEWNGGGAFRLSPGSGEQDLHLDVDAPNWLNREATARPAG